MNNAIYNRVIPIVLVISLIVGMLPLWTVNAYAESGLHNSSYDVSYPENLDDYLGDLDTIVYGLIINQYELCYNCFNAVVELPDGSQVFGIGYTDFADSYEATDGECFFPAGFIRMIGEPEIPADLIAEGLEIFDLDNESDCSFVYAYEIEPYMEHCVIWDQYLKYGIDEHGEITYSVQEYKRGYCDESLGALYSYDQSRFVFDPFVGNYVCVTGTTLYETIDYAELESEINRILEEQDFNFSTVDVQTSVYFAQETVASYLLSMQEETFLGFKVSELVKEVQKLDPMECVRITPNGVTIIDADKDIPETPSAAAKWLVGISCGIVVAGSIALELFVPAMRPVSGAMTGAAVEVFMQVVVQNQNIDNVNWSRVAVAATSGALLAWACPLAAASAAKGVVNAAGKEVVTIFGKEIATEGLVKLVGYSVLTFSNSVVTGSTGAAMTFIDGGTAEEALNSFVWGAAIGGACTVFASALSEASNSLMNALAKSHPNSWLLKATESAGAWIGEHQIHLENQKLENILAPKSVYEATKCAINELRREISSSEIFIEEIKQLPADNSKNFVKVDASGNRLTKNQILENGGNCIIKPTADCDPDILAAFEKYNITEIVVKDGVPDFSTISVYQFKPISGITSNREWNMGEYYDQLADEWILHPETIPKEIKAVLTELQLENLDGSLVQQALSLAKLTPHEGTDGIVYLVDHFIHNKVGHYGGVALAKALEKLAIGITYIKQLTHGSASSITGTLIAEGVS